MPLAAALVTESFDLICQKNGNLVETTGFGLRTGEIMAAKKKTAKAKSSDVATATRKAPAKATAKKKATAATAKKVAAKKNVAKKKATTSKVNTSTEEVEVVDSGAATTAAPKKKVAAKKAAPKKATAKKAAAKKKAPAVAAGDPGDFKSFVPYQVSKGEDYMNEDQMEHFRAILLSWKTSLMEEVDRTVGHMKSDATNFPDPNDRATQEEEFSLELRTRDRERKLIKKIEESLTKLDEDEYGFCDGCGVDIGIRRLEARPTANMCIECKTLEEIREKQIA